MNLVVRVEPVDELSLDDGGILLLYENEVVRLGALAAAVVEQCVTPCSLEDIAAALLELFGPPPEGTLDDATIRTITELQEAGVLKVLK